MPRAYSPDSVRSPDQQLEAAREVLRAEAQALTDTADRLGDGFTHAIQLMRQCDGCVLVTGMGKSGLIGQKVAATLASTGTRAHFLHPAEAVHGDLGRVAAGDVVLALSHSGETAELNRILPSLRDLGAILIAITSRSQSTLARAARAIIAYGPVEEACPLRIAPSSSCAAMMGVGDALAFVLMRLRSFGNADFERFHPGGTLGRLLGAVEEIMRVGDRARIASSQLSVSEVFAQVQRPGRRTGAIMLVDDTNKFVGLFTDSDLARLFEKRDLTLFHQPIARFMTRHPVCLRRGERVMDSLALLRERKISEIPVLDEEDRPIGIVDITDLVDLLPEAA